MRWLDGIIDSIDIKSEQAPGVGGGQGTLVWCSPWGHAKDRSRERIGIQNIGPTHLLKNTLIWKHFLIPLHS